MNSFAPSEVGKSQFDLAVRRSRPSMPEIRLSDEASTEASDTEGFLAWAVKRRRFTLIVAFLIALSSLQIGIETELRSSLSYQRVSGELLSVVSAANYIFTFLFTVELVVRLFVYRANFFVHDRMWNGLDMIVVLLALAEAVLDLWVYAFSDSEDYIFDHGDTAKLLRIMRLTRLFRLVKTFRQLRPLRMLVHSLVSAGKSVFWAFLLLFMTVFCFGVILTQAFSEHTGGGTRVVDEKLTFHFGTLHRSMWSLWMAISGAIPWVIIIDPLIKTGNIELNLLFVVYITFVHFFILNVVTGVFCSSAIEGAQQDLDMKTSSRTSRYMLPA
jgi:hypothetical protein